MFFFEHNQLATFQVRQYGDSSVYPMSSRYASAGQFTQALALWHERAPDRWGPSTATSALECPGRVLLAAPK